MQHIHTNEQKLNYDLKNAFIKIRFLVVPICGASLVSAFSFCDAFCQISPMYLLNFNLQLHIMPISFSLRELFRSQSYSVIQITYFERVRFFNSRWHLSAFSFISLFKNQFKSFSPISSKAFTTSTMLFLTTNGVLSSVLTSKISGF